MSSLRPAKIVATLFQLIGGDLALPVDAGGPGCSCEQCQKAWTETHKASHISPRAQVGLSLRRFGPG
jgi:hypothetical protein